MTMIVFIIGFLIVAWLAMTGMARNARLTSDAVNSLRTGEDYEDSPVGCAGELLRGLVAVGILAILAALIGVL